MAFTKSYIMSSTHNHSSQVLSTKPVVLGSPVIAELTQKAMKCFLTQVRNWGQLNIHQNESNPYWNQPQSYMCCALSAKSSSSPYLYVIIIRHKSHHI